jgi:hypothetical protein
MFSPEQVNAVPHIDSTEMWEEYMCSGCTVAWFLVICCKKKVNYCMMYSFPQFYLTIIIRMMIIMMMVMVLSFHLKVLHFIGKHSTVW